MQSVFLGCFIETVDEDGRVRIPDEFRPGTGEGTWVLVPPLEEGTGLLLFPAEALNRERERFRTNPTIAAGKSAAHGKSVLLEADAHGRVQIPDEMLSCLCLGEDREIRFIGEMTRIRVVGKQK